MKGEGEKRIWKVPGVGDRWFRDGWDACGLGEGGRHFVRSGGQFRISSLPFHQYSVINGLGERVKRMFLSKESVLVTYT